MTGRNMPCTGARSTWLSIAASSNWRDPTRCGPDAAPPAGEIAPDGGVTVTFQTRSGEIRETGSLLIGADGIHSGDPGADAPRPAADPLGWCAVMWRGTSLAKPVRTGSSFIGLGTHKHRMVIYPISAPDPETGLALTSTGLPKSPMTTLQPMRPWVGSAGRNRRFHSPFRGLDL